MGIMGAQGPSSRVVVGCIIFAIILLVFKDTIISKIISDSKAASNGFLHRLMQTAIQSTQLHVDQPQPVFIKIPRTGADSLRTCLFANANVTYIDPGYTDAPEKSQDFERYVHAPYLFGHVSGSEVKAYNSSHGPIRLFTVLRDPVERAISYYNFVGRGKKHGEGDMSVYQFFTSKNEDIRAFIQNSMVWQLGDHINPSARSLSAQEALQQAKCLVSRMTAVAFFDDFVDDFDLLHSKGFPEVEGNWHTRQMFKLGEILRPLGWSSRRWSSDLSDADLKIVEDSVQLDQELYDFSWRWWKDPSHDSLPDPCDPSAVTILGQSTSMGLKATTSHRARARVLRMEIYGVILLLIFSPLCCYLDLKSRIAVHPCLAGVVGSLVLHCALQEYVMTHSSYGRSISNPILAGMFLTMCDCMATCLILAPWAISTFSKMDVLLHEIISGTEVKWTLAEVAASVCQYSVLDFVSFFTQAMVRIASFGPMTWMSRDGPTFAQRLELTICTLGVLAVSLSIESGITWWSICSGFILLSLMTILNQFTDKYHRASIHAAAVSNTEQMLLQGKPDSAAALLTQPRVIVFIGAALGLSIALPLLFLSGHLWEALQFLFNHSEARFHVIALACSSAMARYFLCNLVESYSSCALQVISVFQLLFSAGLSQFVFSHEPPAYTLTVVLSMLACAFAVTRITRQLCTGEGADLHTHGKQDMYGSCAEEGQSQATKTPQKILLVD